MSQTNPLRHSGFPLLKKWKLFMAFLVNGIIGRLGLWPACFLKFSGLS